MKNLLDNKQCLVNLHRLLTSEKSYGNTGT